MDLENERVGGTGAKRAGQPKFVVLNMSVATRSRNHSTSLTVDVIPEQVLRTL